MLTICYLIYSRDYKEGQETEDKAPYQYQRRYDRLTSSFFAAIWHSHRSISVKQIAII